METVNYRGVEYPIKEVVVGSNVQRISVDTLNDAMFDTYGCVVNDDAEDLDNTIFYYVPADIFKKSDRDIAKFIKENIL